MILKFKNRAIILILVIGIFIVFEGKALFINGSLILANLMDNTSYFRGDEIWVNRFNQAIRLSDKGQFMEAKTMLAPLLNDTTISKKAEVAELYGDLIYTTSGALNDSITMYERSLGFSSNERIECKIAYLKSLQNKKENPQQQPEKKPENTNTSTGSKELDVKREELKQIAKQRADFLGSATISTSESRGELQKLIELAASGSTQNTQDW